MKSSRTVFLAGAALVLAALAAYRNSLDAPFLFDDMPAILQNRTIRHLWPPWEALHPPVDGSGVSGRPLVNYSLAVNYAIGKLDVRGYHAMNLALHVLTTLALWGVLRRTLGHFIPVAASAEQADHPIATNANERNPLAGARRQGPLAHARGHGPESRASSLPSEETHGLPARGRSPLRQDHAELFAWSVALLWTVHPLLTESVVCVVQRNEILGSLFYLLTIYCFARGTESSPVLRLALKNKQARAEAPRFLTPPSAGGVTAAATRPGHQGRSYSLWLALSFLACLAGVASKEIVATVPLLVLLYDRTFAAGSFRAAWQRRKKFYFALAATWLLLGWLVWHNRQRGGTVGFGLGVTPWEYLLTQCRALVIYLKLSLWPHPLVIDYGTAVVRNLGAVWWQGLLVVASLAATAVALVRRPVVGFIAASFFIMLAPSSSFVPLVTQTIAEHRMYLPLAAVLVLVVAGVRFATGMFQRVARRTSVSPAFPGEGLAASAVVMCVIAALVLGIATAKRNDAYRDESAVWREALTAEPGNARALSGLGTAQYHRGDFAGALHSFTESLRLDPNSVLTHYNLGLTLYKMERMEDAATQYAEALRLDSHHVPARAELAAALVKLGRTDEALAHLRRALDEAPLLAETHNTFGMAMAAKGNPAKAIRAYETAIALDPEMPNAHYNLALALGAQGRIPEALEHYTEAVRLDPALVEARLNLGILLAQSGRRAEALAQLRAAVRLRPEMAAAHCNLGILLAEMDRTQEAMREYREALRLQPDYATAHYNLGNALVQLRQWSEAKRQYAEAVRLAPGFAPAREMLERLESVP
jgi:tetratricopeptide (TPR) repeat protein